MIEVFDSRTRQQALCHDRERLAALAAHNAEMKKIRQQMAQIDEREATRISR